MNPGTSARAFPSRRRPRPRTYPPPAPRRPSPGVASANRRRAEARELAELVVAAVVLAGRALSVGELLGQLPERGKAEVKACVEALASEGRLVRVGSCYSQTRGR